MFHILFFGDFGVSKIGNDGVSKIIGVGHVYLRTHLLLKVAKHVPYVLFDLVFLHLLDDCDYNNHLCFGKRKLNKGNLVMCRERNYKLYWT